MNYLNENYISSVTRHWGGPRTFVNFIYELRVFLSRVLYYFGKIGRQTFTLRGQRYKYFYHRYNMTWRNERCVELPVVLDVIRKYEGKKILEIGNVLSYYIPTNHDVVDKFETHPKCMNIDIVDFKPNDLFDVAVSVSTLEHMGFDEDKKNPQKIEEALSHIRKYCLKPGGLLLATFPYGYNPHLDELIRGMNSPFSQLYYLKRKNLINEWEEIQFTDIKKEKYGFPFPAANILVIGMMKS